VTSKPDFNVAILFNVK